MKKKLDLEAKIHIFCWKLKVQEEKKYSDNECEHNIAYVFDNYESYQKYFIENNLKPKYLARVCDICEMKKTKKGIVIALKVLCDNAIKVFNNIDIQKTPNESEQTLIKKDEQCLSNDKEKRKILSLKK